MEGLVLEREELRVTGCRVWVLVCSELLHMGFGIRSSCMVGTWCPGEGSIRKPHPTFRIGPNEPRGKRGNGLDGAGGIV